LTICLILRLIWKGLWMAKYSESMTGKSIKIAASALVLSHRMQHLDPHTLASLCCSFSKAERMYLQTGLEIFERTIFVNEINPQVVARLTRARLSMRERSPRNTMTSVISDMHPFGSFRRSRFASFFSDRFSTSRTISKQSFASSNVSSIDRVREEEELADTDDHDGSPGGNSDHNNDINDINDINNNNEASEPDLEPKIVGRKLRFGSPSISRSSEGLVIHGTGASASSSSHSNSKGKGAKVAEEGGLGAVMGGFCEHGLDPGEGSEDHENDDKFEGRQRLRVQLKTSAYAQAGHAVVNLDDPESLGSRKGVVCASLVRYGMWRLCVQHLPGK